MRFNLLRDLFSRKRLKKSKDEIDPDEIFLDSINLPSFDRLQFEGRIEKPIERRVVLISGAVCVAFLLIFLLRSGELQLLDGSEYLKQSEENRLHYTIIFGERGIIQDRNGKTLAWNESLSSKPEFAIRKYSSIAGNAHTVGFIKYPSKDSSGFYYKVDFEGKDGVEKFWDENLAPRNGIQIVETDVFGRVKSESVQRRPVNGENISLSVDARLSEKLFKSIRDLAIRRGFEGGAGIIMDVENGEVIAMASDPEYDAQTLTDGTDVDEISRVVNDKGKPFLNRVTNGLYTPGSIIKPFIALAALEEKIITPEKKILSAGSISVPNPYDAERPSVFKDWKAHGEVDMRQALAVSSDVYFYAIGGGYKTQAGLGIEKIEKYMRLFGFGEVPSENAFWGEEGVIPNPKWKSDTFNGESWRIGNTYHTAIGQYGFQVTPLQAVRAISAIANNGRLLSPVLVKTNKDTAHIYLKFSQKSFDVVREGMRQAVISGTASGLSNPWVSVAAKTGTAELGSKKQFVHSWIVGFFPYEKPRYAFAVVMEKGPSANTIGALFVMRELFEWMNLNTPEYLR